MDRCQKSRLAGHTHNRYISTWANISGVDRPRSQKLPLLTSNRVRTWILHNNLLLDCPREHTMADCQSKEDAHNGNSSESRENQQNENIAKHNGLAFNGVQSSAEQYDRKCLALAQLPSSFPEASVLRSVFGLRIRLDNKRLRHVRHQLDISFSGWRQVHKLRCDRLRWHSGDALLLHSNGIVWSSLGNQLVTVD